MRAESVAEVININPASFPPKEPVVVVAQAHKIYEVV
jgi:hypothetical protein